MVVLLGSKRTGRVLAAATSLDLLCVYLGNASPRYAKPHNMETLGHGCAVMRYEPTAHRLDPVLMELDAKLAACSDEDDKRQTAAALAERETTVIGVYRQVIWHDRRVKCRRRNEDIAARLLASLVDEKNSVGAGRVFIDPPVPNACARELCKR